MMGKVISINISEKTSVVKEPVEQALFISDYGIKGDGHAGTGHRQISLLGVESYNRLEEKGRKFSFGSFAENITTEGFILNKLTVGTTFKIGETIQELTQIGKKCHTGCAISQLVGKCVMPKEGIFTKVLKEGIVKPGDSIEIIQ
jgi:MOSC domain-containing protein YiiM